MVVEILEFTDAFVSISMNWDSLQIIGVALYGIYPKLVDS